MFCYKGYLLYIGRINEWMNKGLSIYEIKKCSGGLRYLVRDLVSDWRSCVKVVKVWRVWRFGYKEGGVSFLKKM